MKRRLFNLLAGVSLVLLMAVVVLWVRSRRIVDELDRDASWSSSSKWNGTVVGLGSWNGHIEIILSYNRIRPHGGITGYEIGKPFRWSRWALQRYSWPQADPQWHFCGLYWAASMWFIGGAIIDYNDPDWITKHYGCSDWWIVGLLSIFPGSWLISYMRYRQRRWRIAASLCAKCGYDLRATPERCPECGAVAENSG